MQRDSSAPRTPQSSDKIRIRNYASKSLTKSSFNTPSPVINGKSSQKHVYDLGTIKEKVKKKHKEERNGKGKLKTKEESKAKDMKESKIKKKTNFATCLKELKPINLEKEKVLFF